MFIRSPFLTEDHPRIVSFAEYPLLKLSLTILRISLPSDVDILVSLSMFNVVRALMYILNLLLTSTPGVRLSFSP